MATGLQFVIGLMMVVSLTWAMLALPRLRQRLTKNYSDCPPPGGLNASSPFALCYGFPLKITEKIAPAL